VSRSGRAVALAMFVSFCLGVRRLGGWGAAAAGCRLHQQPRRGCAADAACARVLTQSSSISCHPSGHVSADILRVQRRVDEGTGGYSVETPCVADSSEEEDNSEAHVGHGVITQEAPGLGDTHAATAPATLVRDATPAVATAATATTAAATVVLLLLNC
jgi:hypothetical protein